mmetsp:Transcript_35271/g.83672  ORF Transcript_35271/g.83672 Transcript_35271/m.83672 type:complete len:271 (-) Transcript_35271:1100-1912(-)
MGEAHDSRGERHRLRPEPDGVPARARAHCRAQGTHCGRGGKRGRRGAGWRRAEGCRAKRPSHADHRRGQGGAPRSPRGALPPPRRLQPGQHTELAVQLPGGRRCGAGGLSRQRGAAEGRAGVRQPALHPRHVHAGKDRGPSDRRVPGRHPRPPHQQPPDKEGGNCGGCEEGTGRPERRHEDKGDQDPVQRTGHLLEPQSRDIAPFPPHTRGDPPRGVRGAGGLPAGGPGRARGGVPPPDITRGAPSGARGGSAPAGSCPARPSCSRCGSC